MAADCYIGYDDFIDLSQYIYKIYWRGKWASQYKSDFTNFYCHSQFYVSLVFTIKVYDIFVGYFTRLLYASYMATVEPEQLSTSEPEPEAESSPEPEPETTSEPETTAETEPEIFSEPEPEISNPEPESNSWPEPGPHWPEAYGEWGVAWHLHVFLFGTIYLLMCLCAIFILCSYFSRQKSFKKGSLTYSLLAMTIIFNFCRILTFFGDPYSTSGRLTPVVSRLLWTLPTPFLLSSFSLILLVLLDTTKFQLGPPRFQKLSTILLFTTAHLVLVLTSDLLVYYSPTSKAMLVICQCLFIIFGLLISVGFLYTGVKIRSNCASGLLAGKSTSYNVFVCFFLHSRRYFSHICDGT